MQVEEVELATEGDITQAVVEAAAQALDELPIHVARCASCQAGVKYRMTTTGVGIVVLERYGMQLEESIGLGESAMPLCPFGHGEMRGEDETIPASEAITRVAEQLAEQQPLPGVVLPFNYEGAYLELAEKAQEVDRLKRESDDAATEAREAKKRWDKAAQLYTTMALEFERRRRQKAGEPATDLLDASERPETPRLVKCLFEERHADTPCPLCAGGSLPGIETAVRDSEKHIEQAMEYILRENADAISSALDDIGIVFSPRDVLQLDVEARTQLGDWLEDAVAHPEERSRWMEAKPAAFKTSHVAGSVIANTDDGTTRQECRTCGDTLLVLGEDDEPCAPGTLYGADCRGKRKPAEPEHHYTKRHAGGKKPRTKK